LVEHPAQDHATDIAVVNCKSDDAPRELIHDYKHPVGLEQNRLTPEQIYTPQAVFHMPDEGQP
jgi:hypothetical protein